MNILALNGSPRPHGNTAAMAAAALSVLMFIICLGGYPAEDGTTRKGWIFLGPVRSIYIFNGGCRLILIFNP